MNKKFVVSIAGLILYLVTVSAWASIIGTTVSGKQTVYFAGRTLAELDAIRVADGTYSASDYFGDLIDPNTLPNAIDITGLGDLISISASGEWSHASPEPAGASGPEGRAISYTSSTQYGIFGISLLTADLNTLVGVFLSDVAPDLLTTPTALSTVVLDPLLNQSFAIGASLENIMVPIGATRLYLGLHDGFEWTNNWGSVDVVIADVPEPTTLALMGLGLAGIGYRRHRSRIAA